jgi:hypothetical protein
MFYLHILVFYQVGILSRLEMTLLCGTLLQVVICCLNPSIGYCLCNKHHCILVTDRSHVLHVLIIRQTELFLQEDNIIKDVKESYAKDIPYCS